MDRSQDKTEEFSEKKMGFFQHVDEIRVRVVRSVWVFVIGFLAAYAVSDHVMNFLKHPLFQALPEEKRVLYFTSLFENFMTHLKISGYTALVVLSPYFFYQLWAFIAPGLRSNEKKWFVPFVSAAGFFFLIGASFAYYVLFPVGFKYFITYGTSSEVPMITIDGYFSMCLKLIFLFGFSFELPVFICLLGAIGLVDAAFLKLHRRTALLLITIVSALVAPPDAMSMIMLGAPLYLLYECSIWVVQYMGLKRKKTDVESDKNPLHGGAE
jgi:sec-independent protein translocase protein TatC